MKRIIKYNELLKIINNSFYDSLLPFNLNIWYQFGSLLGLCLGIQIITGILLACYYIPNINMAFDSVENIMREVPYGWMIRYTHSNGASLFFICIYMHILRGLLYGSYLNKRNVVWNIGIILYLLVVITAFLGYCLPWGQQSFWGATVITNLLSTIPLIGKELVEYIWGDWSVGGPTLNRFFAIHYLLPFIISGLTITHIITLHNAGSSNPLGLRSNNSTINFHSYYTLKDILGFLIIFIILIILVFYYPNILGHSDNYIKGDPLITPQEIIPEWYLLPFYAILRSIPNKTLGVVGMIGSILSLALLNKLHLSIINTSNFRPIYKIWIYLFINNFILLLWIGQEIVSDPYILIGKLLTFFYFFLLFFIFPFISFFEFFLIFFRGKDKIRNASI